MSVQHMVYIVDDDPGIRKSLSWMMEQEGLLFSAYQSAEAFLEHAGSAGAACLILDMCLPDMNGLELLKVMKSRPELCMPAIAFSGFGTVATAVETMKLGVRDFLEKPVQPEVLLEKVRESLAADVERRLRDACKADVKNRVALLTDRERQVLNLICEGKSTKEIAATLDISTKTVSIHRWHLMRKMQAGSATEVVSLAYRARAA